MTAAALARLYRESCRCGEIRLDPVLVSVE
jgi:hypothetical protein